MSVYRGNKQTFIGMDVELIKDKKKLKILTKDYINEAIEEFGEDIGPKVATPAKCDLFDIDENSPELSNEKVDKLHSIVAKLLFVTRRSRLDILTTIAFLQTRVSCSTEQDWEKLRRYLSYLKHTIDMPRIISIEDYSIMKI